MLKLDGLFVNESRTHELRTSLDFDHKIINFGLLHVLQKFEESENVEFGKVSLFSLTTMKNLTVFIFYYNTKSKHDS
jgi:hypothetical protein